MKRILFQGDSITDCGRKREDFYGMGSGYANLVKASLGMERPAEFEFVNRGVSGNRIVDLYARMKIDLINLAPDYLSIFIGVNDVWHEIAKENGVATAKFEKIYSMLLDEIREALPETKIMLIAPFVLHGTATCDTEEKPDRWERFQVGVAEKAEVVKKLAKQYGLPCIELQGAFDEACRSAPPEYWTRDGVHPTACGHEIIKRKWIDALKELE
ncbi:MAG: lysophospholipase [Ruminococcaceae bacterium]|nr:lysophospholipase [Oscillospiraceae bacterium]